MKVKLNEKGLVPAIAQDINTGEILMLGYMNPGSLKRTVEGEQVWFYSRSREDLWHKGEISGNYLNLREALRGLRRRYPSAQGGARRPRLPHRRNFLLLHPYGSPSR